MLTETREPLLKSELQLCSNNFKPKGYSYHVMHYNCFLSKMAMDTLIA